MKRLPVIFISSLLSIVLLITGLGGIAHASTLVTQNVWSSPNYTDPIPDWNVNITTPSSIPAAGDIGYLGVTDVTTWANWVEVGWYSNGSNLYVFADTDNGWTTYTSDVLSTNTSYAFNLYYDGSKFWAGYNGTYPGAYSSIPESHQVYGSLTAEEYDTSMTSFNDLQQNGTEIVYGPVEAFGAAGSGSSDPAPYPNTNCAAGTSQIYNAMIASYTCTFAFPNFTLSGDPTLSGPGNATGNVHAYVNFMTVPSNLTSSSNILGAGQDLVYQIGGEDYWADVVWQYNPLTEEATLWYVDSSGEDTDLGAAAPGDTVEFGDFYLGTGSWLAAVCVNSEGTAATNCTETTGDWSGVDTPISGSGIPTLEAADLLNMAYSNGSSSPSGYPICINNNGVISGVPSGWFEKTGGDTTKYQLQGNCVFD